MRILVIRNDKLGDFMLAFPAFGILKNNIPGAEITALVPEYTREMAECCPSIDSILVDDFDSSSQMAEELRKRKFDVAVVFYSTARVALALLRAKIPVRLAPATKWFQFFYTYRLAQRRSRSLKPEYEYNNDLAKHFLDLESISNTVHPSGPYLSFAESEISNLRRRFLAEQNWDDGNRLVFVHAGSGGSARNLSGEQFLQLANDLARVPEVCIVFSAGPAELRYAAELADHLPRDVATVYESTAGLKVFALHLAMADVFISGSTGPLHIAGALDTPTAGFYTRRRSATALRWQTLNSPERRLAFSPPDDAEPEDMSRIDISAAAMTIQERFLRA